MIKELASRDPSCINDGDEDSNTALHLAAMEGNVKVVHCLLMIGADVNVRFVKLFKKYNARLKLSATVSTVLKIIVKACKQ